MDKKNFFIWGVWTVLVLKPPDIIQVFIGVRQDIIEVIQTHFFPGSPARLVMADNDNVGNFPGMNNDNTFEDEQSNQKFIFDIVKKNFFGAPIGVPIKKSQQEIHFTFHLVGMDFKFVMGGDGTTTVVAFCFLYF
jgi:hypothetical protein